MSTGVHTDANRQYRRGGGHVFKPYGKYNCPTERCAEEGKPEQLKLPLIHLEDQLINHRITYCDL